jgi:hypothetical protein
LCHTKDSSPEEKKLLFDVNNNWVKYQVVIITNRITTSIDFHEKHFHAIVGFVHNDTINFRNIRQMFGRVRNPIDGLLMVNFQLKTYNFPVATGTIARGIMNEIESITTSVNNAKISAADLLAMQVNDNKRKVSFGSSGISNVTYDSTHWFTRIHLLNRHEDNVNKNDMRYLFNEWVEEQEIDYTQYNYVCYNREIANLYKNCDEER